MITNPLIAENERLRARIKRLEQQNAALEKERDTKKAEASKHHSTVSEQKKDIARLQDRLRNAREHIHRLQNEPAA